MPLRVPPEASYPFLVPEYILDGVSYRPIEYYTKIDVLQNDGTVTVKASGMLARCGGEWSTRTDYPFSVSYAFSENEIQVKYECNQPFDFAKMTVGTHGDSAKILPFGVYSEKQLSPIGDYSFMTPHGQIDLASELTYSKTERLGYEIILK